MFYMFETFGSDRRPPKRPVSRLARWRSRLLEGEHLWGSIDIWPGRHGVHRYRLVVFPPGITSGQRRLLHLRRTWPMWGAALWLSSAIGFGAIAGRWAAIGLATFAYLGAVAMILALARRLKSRIRTLGMLVVDGQNDWSCAAGYAELETLVDNLRDADTKYRDGRLSAVDHEALCWQVYDRLGPGHPRPVEGRLST